VDIVTAMESPELFGRWFRKSKFLGRDTWGAWRVFLKALFALPMTDAERVKYERHTGRSDVSAAAYREACLLVGRRGGKSRIAAFIGSYLAAFKDYSGVLSVGEVGVVALIAADRRQARVLLSYLNGFFDGIPLLAEMVESRTREAIQLKNGIRIEIFTASYRTVRGFTIVAAIGDEVCFWPNTEGAADADAEIVAALRPAMSTIPDALLLLISTPYARRGVMWTSYKQNFGVAGAATLYWQSDTRSMNPQVSQLTIAAAYVKDRAAASAEYGAQWRDDIAGFVPIEIVESRVVKNRHELPRVDGVTYYGFCDPSGGVGDGFTMAVAHFENETAVLDCVREVPPPCSPEQVVREFAQVFKSYGVSEITGDHYAGMWPREAFSKCGVSYTPSDRNRSQIYLEALPLLMSGTCVLLDNPKLIAQLVGLERKTGRGADTIDHAPSGHDDVCNSAMGAIVRAFRAAGGDLGLIAFEKKLMAGGYDAPTEKQSSYLRDAQAKGVRPFFGGAGIDWKKKAEPKEPMVTVATFVRGVAGTKEIPASQFGVQPAAILSATENKCPKCGAGCLDFRIGRCSQCGLRFSVN
jgi:hypothetical protein